jgi:hypothetical protein
MIALAPSLRTVVGLPFAFKSLAGSLIRFGALKLLERGGLPSGFPILRFAEGAPVT